uniref:Uncharacterized protein n=1 Tax=Fagus sylvatica TaxID=28930 RepID=A0A2N9FX43_FAGSY
MEPCETRRGKRLGEDIGKLVRCRDEFHGNITSKGREVIAPKNGSIGQENPQITKHHPNPIELGGGASKATILKLPSKSVRQYTASWRPREKESLQQRRREAQYQVVVDEDGSVVGIGADADGDNATGGVGIGSGCVSSGIGSCVSAVRLGVGVGQAGDGGDLSVGPSPNTEG